LEERTEDAYKIHAYAGGEPVGWCAVAPREAYTALQRSRVLKPVDADPVWAIVCFVVARPFRRRGLSVHLLKAAVQRARERGARIVEGYPVESVMVRIFRNHPSG